MASSEQIIEDYLRGISLVERAFSDMNVAQLHSRPIQGRWSSMEVLCHIVDTDFAVAHRMRSAIKVPTARLPATDLVEATTHLSVDHRELSEELACFAIVRSQLARILRAQPPSAIERAVTLYGQNGQEIARSPMRIISNITAHAVHHLAHVNEKRAALGLAIDVRSEASAHPV